VTRRSAAAGFVDRGDVDLLHRHHHRKCSVRLLASGGHGLRERSRRDLPGDTPAIFAPAALALLPAVADDGVPVAIRFFLIVRCDLEGERLRRLERRTTIDPDARNADDRELDRQDLTGFAAGKSPGALRTAVTWLFGNVAA